MKRKEGITTFLLFLLMAELMLLGFMIVVQHFYRVYPYYEPEWMEKVSAETGVPVPWILSTIKVESNFDTEAVSVKGARGLMQLMPGTFRWLADQDPQRVYRIEDPADNVLLGARYLAYLYQKYGSWDLVSAAYNAGDGTVDRWLSDPRYGDGTTLHTIPYPETERHVRRVRRAYEIYCKLYFADEMSHERRENMEEKTAGQKLSEELTYRKKNVYEEADEARIREIYTYAEGYKAFLDAAKTEREAVRRGVAMAEAAGYTEYHLGDPLQPGDCRYFNNRDKSLILFRIGHFDIEKEGMRILAAHVDSPRLDLKQNPLYEEAGMGFFKTHYYGGIKKYQWTAIPLALHGVVVLSDGSSVEIRIGEEEADPVFYINDLLPHLSRDQMTRPASSVIPGESLNILVGGLPYADDKVENRIKLNVLHILHERYGIREEDFISAELTAVPAFRARDIGFDRALIGAYGHDDRVCAYPEMTAILSCESNHTAMCILADKEEIGSDGVSGMQSCLLTDMIDAISRALGADAAVVRAHSMCLSADVNAAYDPNFSDAFERRNSAMLSCGTTMSKYTGSGGKSGTSDASAELVGRIRKIFADNGVIWQTSELGKVDGGGGGTVAKYIANMNIDTVDIGVPVISMHAPYEVVSKADLYATHEAFAAFLR